MRWFAMLLWLCLANGVLAQPERVVVEGVGRTDDDARAQALRRGHETFVAYLQSREPPILAWSPTLDSMRPLITATAPRVWPGTRTC